ncbi:MBL fold metallo-hydrolase [Anaerolineae bacterium CFX9]|jgi:glyoxylase-like metal-dependent hydrolase (beta-lactamase superfamily II)|nr:MBL fold metallo-hydrolase [Anaerolineae bacterium CFX9]
MQRERIADDIYVFVSDLYVQATATVIVTTEGVVLFDTLLYPEETRAIRRFVENRLNNRVAYVINSHYHADHTAGTCLFPEARIVSNTLCRDLLDRRGRDSLERARTMSPDLRDVELILPEIIFDRGHFTLHVGNKTFEMWLTPGHSMDSMVCLVKEDRTLLGADTMMPLPYFVDGSYDDFLVSLAQLRNGNYENVVQGHGDVILRGEIEDKISSDIDYLLALRDAVDAALNEQQVEKALNAIDVERCGKSRILLNGAVEQLHRQNVMSLASQRCLLMRSQNKMLNE